MAEKQCEGKCPNCGSDKINWHDSELNSMFAIYKGVCEQCDTSFQEEYTLVYNTTTYNE